MDYDLTHQHGGNGYAVVQDLGDDFYKVVSITEDGISKHAYLAARRLLRRSDYGEGDRPLMGKTLDAVKELREDLQAGRKIIREQRILAA